MMFSISSVNSISNNPTLLNKNIDYKAPKYARDNVSFNGLSNKLGKYIYLNGNPEIKFIMKQRANQSTIVGSLPKFMLDKLPKENRKEAISEIFATFKQIAQELKDFDVRKATTIDEIKNKRYDSTAKLFDNIMRKYKIVEDYTKLGIKFLGKGGRGSGYKLVGLYDSNISRAMNSSNKIGKKQKKIKDIYEDEFVIKTFFSESFGCNNHGCCSEINGAQYWMNTVGKNTQRGKFFFGDPANGYMVSKYVDEDVRLPRRNIPFSDYGLSSSDENYDAMHNTCKQYGFDWGGINVENIIKNRNKIARHFNNKIRETKPQERSYVWNMLFSKNRMINNESKNAGLALGIEYMNNKKFYFEQCLALNQPEVNRALGYTLKFLPYEESLKYFAKLAETKDAMTQIILFREIPKLTMKIIDNPKHGDFKLVINDIIPSRLEAYSEIAKKYCLPETKAELSNLTYSNGFKISNPH